MKLKHLIHAALLLLITPLTQAQFATGDVAVFEKKSTAGFELKAVEDTGLILPLANGGLGASLTDPGADRIPFWDDSGTTVTWLTLGTGLSITGTTINASAVLGDADYGDIVVSSSGTAINIDTGRKSTGALGSGDAGKLATFASGGYLMGTVVSAGDSVTPGNDYITLETDGVNGQTIRGYHTDGMDEHEYILHLPTTSMSDTSVEWWLPEALPTVNGQVLTGQTDGTTAWATASGGIAGSLGSTDNAIPRADGTGGATLQSSGVIIDDSNNLSAAGLTVTNGVLGAYGFFGGYAVAVSYGTGMIRTSDWTRTVNWTDGNIDATPFLVLGPSANATATLQLGTNHATTPTAQGIKAHNVTTGTGASLTLSGGTGSTAGGSVIIGTSATTGAPTAHITVTAGGNVILATATAPSTASDTGTAGEIRFDSSYIYYCTATDTWKRVAIATW